MGPCMAWDELERGPLGRVRKGGKGRAWEEGSTARYQWRTLCRSRIDVVIGGLPDPEVALLALGSREFGRAVVSHHDAHA